MFVLQTGRERGIGREREKGVPATFAGFIPFSIHVFLNKVLESSRQKMGLSLLFTYQSQNYSCGDMMKKLHGM